ncbi:hypothetical protein [Amycolatopsis taiwanensis]|nr:hypothetical protein [Amycolatopsis taiwanensis]
MSPVSRGRKKKNKGRSTKPRRTAPMLSSPFAGTTLSRPDWFDASIKSVLDGAEATLSAHSTRELEQVVAELIGAELHQAVHDDRDGLRFDWLFHEIVDAAAVRRREGSTDSMDRLLHGLAAIGTPALRAYTEQHLPKRAVGDWPRVTATGKVWRMRDAYGTRFGVIAGFTYPGVFLFDVDGSSWVRLMHVDVFDDVEQAATAWREQVGDSANGVEPQPISAADELLCLRECETGELGVMGDESRNVMDNWFRVNRRLHDLADLDLLPEPVNLYQGVDPGPMAEEFTRWYAMQDSAEPNPEIAEAIAAEWLEGSLPETWFCVSPARISYIRALISDWVDEYAGPGEAMLAPWARWLVQRADLPEHLSEPVFAALDTPAVKASAVPGGTHGQCVR